MRRTIPYSVVRLRALVATLFAVLLALVVSLAVAQSAPPVAGTLYLTNNGGSSLATITPSPFSAQNIGDFGTTQTWAAAFDTNGDLYTLVNNGESLARVNTSTGQATIIAPLWPAGGSMMALEISSTGVMYSADQHNQDFLRINKATGEKTVIGNFGIPGGFAAMDFAFDSHDNLYVTGGFGPPTLDLYRVDTATGHATFATTITGLDHENIMTIAFDQADVLYVTTFTSPANLYRVDLATGAATRVGNTGLNLPHGGDFPQVVTPTSADQCRNFGWQTFTNPKFKNQGDCVSYVATNGRNGGNG